MLGLGLVSKFRRRLESPAAPVAALPIELGPMPVSEEIVRGRSIHDGYQRGCLLMHSDLPARIDADALYAAAVEASGGWSIMLGPKRMNLFLLLTRFVPKLESRDVIEFGTYRGGNALFMAHVMREIAPEARVFALDTFEGMPATDASRDAHHAGDFADTSKQALEARRDALGLTNLVVVQGRFEDSFPALAAQQPRFGLAHIDCDIYSAVKYAQDAVWPLMTRGGYVVYDDPDAPSCLGAVEAVEELVMERRLHAEQVWPHWIYRAHLG